MSDNQQVCPHCGRLIEPGYCEYDQKVHAEWLEKMIAEAEQQAIENFKYRMEQAIQAMEHPTRWIQVPTPLTEEQLWELKKKLAKPPVPPVHMHTEEQLPRCKAIQILTDEQMEVFRQQCMEEQPPVRLDQYGYLRSEECGEIDEQQ